MCLLILDRTYLKKTDRYPKFSKSKINPNPYPPNCSEIITQIYNSKGFPDERVPKASKKFYKLYPPDPPLDGEYCTQPINGGAKLAVDTKAFSPETFSQFYTFTW